MIESGPPSSAEERVAARGAALRARIVAAVPGGAVGRRLGLMALVDACGTGAFLALSAIFLTRSVGLSVAQVGFGLATGAAIALITAIPLGALADRYGPRRVLVAVSVWRAACFVAYGLVGSFTGFLVVVCLLGVVDKATAPLEQGLVGSAVAPTSRVRTMAVMRAVRNVGFTIGASMGAVALALDTRPAYVAIVLLNAASFIALAAMAAQLPVKTETADGASLRRPLSFQVLKDTPYLIIAALNAVLTMHMTLLSVGVPIWIAGHSNAPRWVIAPLLLVNTVLAVAFQVRASRDSESSAGAAQRLKQAGLALGTCCVLLAGVPLLSAAAAIGVLAISIVALTAGELLQNAGGWAISYQLARESQRGAYLSVFWLGTSIQQIATPVIVALVIAAGAAAWVALGVLLALAGLAVPAVIRWAVAARANENMPEPESAAPGRVPVTSPVVTEPCAAAAVGEFSGAKTSGLACINLAAARSFTQVSLSDPASLDPPFITLRPGS